MSSSKRGAASAPEVPRDGPTYDQLYAEARRRNIRGRSSMNKAELKRKLGR